MTSEARTILICSCEDTMPLAADAVRKGCAGTVETARQLCRTQVARFSEHLAQGKPLIVGCTQEAPLFSAIAAEADNAPDITFVNLRETAGWSNEASGTGPKMAALIAAASEPMPGTAYVALESGGVAMIYGRDEIAIDIARQLALEDLDVTVLLNRPGDVTPPRVNEAPVLKGTIVAAKGYLGAFELSVNDYAQPAPSSRAKLVFGPARDGAVSHCDILIDVSGGMPLFPADDLRPGYLRADPRDRVAVEKLIRQASALSGTFDKPRYIDFTADLCAHSRASRTGCTRCLDLCPTGAITPDGDHVSISAEICAGCGACAAVCPTGAASYALPPADALMRRLRALLMTYADAGGHAPVLLLHDSDHGEPLIDALARFGDGLPARVLPLAVNEVTQVGLDVLAAAFAHGATGVRILTRGRARHDISGLTRNIDTANAILSGLGYGADLCTIIATDDPDVLGADVRAPAADATHGTISRFRAMGAGRDLLTMTMRELRHAAPKAGVRSSAVSKTARLPAIPLPPLAPFGKAAVDAEGCTLCLACVSACPTAAFTANPDSPMLRFQEDLCVQCGLCAATCPENVITLVPQLDFAAWDDGAVIVKQEEPFHCISCNKAFGTKSTVERIVAKLEGKHWMFSGDQAKRISVIRMCEDCRVEVVVNESFDPHASPQRPAPRTTEDYLRERAERDGKDSLN